ncbi:glycosyltransferase family 2 protein [Desulfogranum mediterraneum]|uniref:glycosyltransferase family 2 protein n=1 Tax=Desulfogranum mediterraneum TaxID=160661 RepID=UPI000414E028|nr:glycosyltransferase family A protein [Desulfogranum mediterraneum]
MGLDKHEPLVSVVTPVYNGEKYLEACVKSVLSQSYGNFEYIIVNNCSTDNTLEVAQRCALLDRRISVHSNEQFFSVIENWNNALGYISPESRYCKQVHADDLLFPECLSRMVAVAERDAAVVMVGSYRIAGTRTECGGLAYPQEIFDGNEICRRVLLEDNFRVFGSPSTILIRADAIRDADGFYRVNSVLAADHESGFQYLKDKKWGYVHQILSLTRVHPEQVSSFVRKFRVWELDYLMLLKRYGPVYLSGEELAKRMKEVESHYYFNSARAIFFSDEKKRYLNYHQETMQRFGAQFSYSKLFLVVLKSLLNNLLNPVGLLKRVVSKVKSLLVKA